MSRNLKDKGHEIPEMKILLKDHKAWEPNSPEPVPSRPVVNGRAGFNSHLSELLADILEPVAKEMVGSEINSTEEALAIIQKHNDNIDNGVESENMLEIISERLRRQTTSVTGGDQPVTTSAQTRVDDAPRDQNISHMKVLFQIPALLTNSRNASKKMNGLTSKTSRCRKNMKQKLICRMNMAMILGVQTVLLTGLDESMEVSQISQTKKG